MVVAKRRLWLIFGAFGGLVLFLYGIIPTFQKAHFHRTYAAYGGIFVVMALIWGLVLIKKTRQI